MRALLLALALRAVPAAGGLDGTPPLAGAPARAGGLLEAGHPEEALRALGHASRPEARFLRGLALEAAGDAAGALRALDGLEVRLPDLADRVLAARGRLLAGAGRHREAATALGRVPAGSLLAPTAALGRAAALRAGGDAAGAEAALAPLLPGGAWAAAAEAGRALLAAAELRAAADPPDPDGARRLLVECWAGLAAAPEAPTCLSALRALPDRAGAAPGPEEVVRRAEGLLDANRHGEAAALLEPVVRSAPPAGPDEPLACRARAALGRAMRRDRQNARAAELLRPVAARCAAPAVRARALYVLATAVAAQGEREPALALHRRFAAEEPESPLADDALFAAADLALRLGRPDEARDLLAALLRDHPGGDRADEARFRLAWLARRSGDAAAAIASLLEIEEQAREVDPYERARAAYWRARLLAGAGPQGEAAARAIWRDLVESGPADYYALLARARLAGDAGLTLPEPLPSPAAPAASPGAGPLAANPHFRAGVLLLGMGMERTAATELSAAARPGLGREAGEGPVVLLAGLLDRAGEHRAAHQLVRTEARAALRRPPAGPDRRTWEVAYPEAHRDLVRRHAPPAGVPPELLLALMREESALDPAALSPAGAVGLTQLMLPTAQGVARRLGLRRPDRAALTDPATSIRLGAAHLGELLAAFDGSAPLAVAAYNAGAAAVARWRAAGGGLELDELVEEIPYDETRGYVKRVLRSWAAYRLLSGAASARAAALPDPPPG